jgi:hypothetical protein
MKIGDEHPHGIRQHKLDTSRRPVAAGSATGRNRPDPVRIAPWPNPVALSEPRHDGERMVYESFLSDSPGFPGYAVYSMPLPLSDSRRLEADFVAVTSQGIALIEVKGGIVRVDSRPGPSVRWEHFTRAGRPTGSYVTPTQIYRVAAAFDIAAQAMTGISFGSRIAQLLVLPHTSRNLVDVSLLNVLYRPDRDFLRIVFAEDLTEYGMWSLVADELAKPGRSRPFSGTEVDNLCRWVVSELDVRPGPGHIVASAESDSIQCLNPYINRVYEDHSSEHLAAPPQIARETPRVIARVPRQSNAPDLEPPVREHWRLRPKRIHLALAVLFAASIYLLGRHAVERPPSAAETTLPEAVPTAPQPRPNSGQDSFQTALTRAAAEPEKRIAVSGNNWVRVLGPISGRPGCQYAEIAYNGKTFNVVACRDGDRGTWRY